MEKWYRLNKVGQLYKEIDLVYGNEPVLFVCKDSFGQRYLFMTYDSVAMEYVFAPVTSHQLLDMLENRVTMEQTFRNCREIDTTEEADGIITVKRHSSPDFSKDMLPDAGEFFELDSDEISSYITSLKSEKIKWNQSSSVTTEISSFNVSYAARKVINKYSEEFERELALAGRKTRKSGIISISFTASEERENYLNVLEG